MASHIVKLKGKREVAKNTIEFTFEKPDGFEFDAGQYVDITLINPPETDEEGDTRTFSTPSAPFEDNIKIAVRMRDTAFKRTLKSMPVGAEVRMDDAIGQFALPNKTTHPVVMIAGGIGINPFISLLKQEERDGTRHKLFLFSSNRSIGDIVYFDLVKRLGSKNPRLKVIFTLTKKIHKSWNGEEGRMSMKMIEKYVKGLKDAFYLIAGPPLMVRAMVKMLITAGIHKQKIQFEEFTGY